MPHFPIDGYLNVTDEQDIQAKLNDIIAQLPWLVNLTREERQAAITLGHRDQGFLNQVIEVAKQRGEILPAYFDKQDYLENVETYFVYARLTDTVRSVLEMIEDTKLQAGDTVMRKSLAVYHQVKEASQQNVPGMTTVFETMQSRFLSSRNTQTSTDSGEVTPDEAPSDDQLDVMDVPSE